ncbi:hypothetical protein ACHAWC_006867 [Mediolabrus comicus]
MSRQITQPLNQVRLTNVAVVRLQRHGHRFEVACYRNKIVNYRQGTETDLSEVLQTERVFTNVSKGQFANTKILKKCFDTSNEEMVCRFILDNGDVQVSDQERAAQLESTVREVATMVAEKCVHPISRRPYTTTQIRDAMKSVGFMVHPTRNIKQQFLDCVRLLQEKQVLDIERAKMKLAIVLLQQDDGGGDNDDDDDDDMAQKAAQKKSKKAKRREKEDAVEREEKIAAERARQKERVERLGLQNEVQDGATAVNETASTSTNNTTSQASSSSTTTTNTNNGENKACNTCGGSFAPHEYRSHFRSDWHRYNVKLKLKGCATVSEKEFLLCDSDAFF